MERRKCKVTETCLADGVKYGEVEWYGYFHRWMDRAEPVRPELCVGGHQGGQYAQTYGIVEREDGKVALVHPMSIQFIDEEDQ